MIPKKLLKTARTAYVYSDGHAVLVHEERHPKAGPIEWVTLHESIGLERISFEQDGRLILSLFDAAPALAMLEKCKGIRCRAADLDHGSDRSKRLGVAVGYVSLDFGHGYVSFPTMPDLISGPLFFQAGHPEAWADVEHASHWADYRVASIFKKAASHKAALPGETRP